MTLLISVIVILLLAMAGLVFYPWQGQASSDQDSINRAFYRERLRELDAGAEPMEACVRAQLERDLKLSLLDDIPPAPARSAARPPGRWVLVPGVVALVVLSVGMYWKTGASGRVVEMQAMEDETPQLLTRVIDPNAQPLGEAELTRLGQGLRARLQADPDNREGWSILGRIGMVLNNAPLATQAFEKAWQLAPEDPQVKLDYAEVLSRAGDAGQHEQAEQMLRSLRQHDADNPRLLSLLAFNAWQQQHYREALNAWQQLLTVLPASDPRREAIAKNIEQAQVASGIDKAQVIVNIQLSAVAQRNLPQHGVIFVSVSDGQSPVPVAVKRIPLGHFPLTVSLNDSNAMLPEHLLSALTSAKVKVRISASEQATPQAGDWFGQTTVSHFTPATPVTVVVAEQQQ